MHDELQSLANELNDKSRKTKVARRKALVPLKFDSAGNPLTQETFDIRKHLKTLSLDDLRFLKIWRESGWNETEATQKSGIDPDSAKRLVRKLVCFKNEDERVKALADIPTPAWITAKHTENVFEGRLDDSQRDSLKELAKITGSYKQVGMGAQVNIFNLPALSPEQEKKVKEVYDTIAVEDQNAA